jgi:uncharacterized protein YPO0396
MQAFLPMENNGRELLPGFRLKRLEMLNWGTFNGVVQRMVPDCRWTMLVGVNGTGKSTAADALRTLLVPPARATYNDASIDHKLKHTRRDRTKKTYIRGAYGAASQQDSATALTQFLRPEGVQSILLAVFRNELTQVEATLAQILWDQNDKTDQIYLLARSDKNIKENMTDLGKSREMQKVLKRRGFEVYPSFAGYEEAFRRVIGIPGSGALEVFNQAIGVKEVTDLNQFIRKHMLESANMVAFIETQIKPHYAQLNACWEAIKRAEAQLVVLKPLALNYRKMTVAQEAKEKFENLRTTLPAYYGQKHLELRYAFHEEVEKDLSDKEKDRDGLADDQRADQDRKESIASAINNDETGHRLKDIERDMRELRRERDLKMSALENLKRQLGILQYPVTLETRDQFDVMRRKLLTDRSPVESNLDNLEQKKLEHGVSKKRAEDDLAQIIKDAESVRNNKVLIPEYLVRIRALIAQKTGVAETELPFAGELMEVKPEFKPWTGAIERLLCNFGTSLLVPERCYFDVAKYINHHHLGQRLVFFRVPAAKPTIRTDFLNDPKRVPSRLVFDEEKPLTEWVKSEIVRRFAHTCCEDIQSLNQADFGITREGLIRDGTRHVKDDRSPINDRSQYVLGWNTQAKLAALQEAFEAANKQVKNHENRLNQVMGQIKTLNAKITAITDALLLDDFERIDFRSQQKMLDQLHEEQEKLKKSSNKIQLLEKELHETEERILERGKKLQKIEQLIGGLKQRLKDNQTAVNKLKSLIQAQSVDMGGTKAQVEKLQDTPELTLDNIEQIEEQVDKKLQRKSYDLGSTINNLRESVVLAMQDFLRTYPDETADLKADIAFGEEFCTLQHRVEQEDLEKHKQRFFSLLNTNLIMDIAALNTKLTEQEADIRHRIDSVNESLKRIRFSKETYVQIIVSPTKSDEIRNFRGALKQCLSHGIMPAPEDQDRIYTSIRELITEFDKQPEWTNRVTDVRNWLEYGVRELYAANNTEAEYYSASSGKSGGQKSLLAFTILASAITAQYGLSGTKDDMNRFRLVVVDEAFGKTDEENSQRALDLFKELGLQLVVINPFDAKSRIVENYVHSYHLVTMQEEVSSLRRASREEYEAARASN